LKRRIELLEAMYFLFDPVSRSRPQFSKRMVYVADTRDVLQPLASPVSIGNARKALGIRCERIAGRPAWYAPTISLNHALRYGTDSVVSNQKRREERSTRLGKNLAPDLRSFMVDHGLAIPYYEIMDKFKEYRVEMQLGRGFSYTAFSSAVRLLQLEKVMYNGVKYYLLKSRRDGYDPAFEELTELVDNLFSEKGRTISEKTILDATSAYSPAAVLQVDGYARIKGVWHEEGKEKGERFYDTKPPWEGK
jgi:hypothetical protein